DVNRDDVELLTVSVDSTFAHRAWADAEHFQFGLLSDFWPHGEVARLYGVFDSDRGLAIRGTFIIDKDGVVRWKVVNPIPQARDPAGALVQAARPRSAGPAAAGRAAAGRGAAIRTASADAALAEEVGRALDRLLGRA